MAKQTHWKLLLGVFCIITLIYSCKKNDETAPDLSLQGANPLYLQLGDTWIEPGYLANDDVDGDITSKVVITSHLNTEQVNHYELVYSIEDKAGNSTTLIRDVYVTSNRLKGSYHVKDSIVGTNAGIYEYNFSVLQDSLLYNKIIFKNFRGFGESVIVNATVTGPSVTLPSQSPANIPAGYESTVLGGATYHVGEIKTMYYIMKYLVSPNAADTCYSTLNKL
jgi:hypothetical protein